MQEFLSYWQQLLWRAALESWRSVFKFSLWDFIRDALLLFLTFSIAIWWNSTLVKDKIMSADNTQDTGVWLGIGFTAVGILVVGVFIAHLVFITPFRMWREARDAMPPPPPVMKAKIVPPRLLTAHAVERKLRVIDDAVELLKGAQPIIDQGPLFMKDPWHTSQAKAVPAVYGERVATLSREVQSFADSLDKFRRDNPEYADIAAVLNPTFTLRTREKIGEYMNAAACVELAMQEGATFGALSYLFANYVGGFEQGLKLLADWRDKARAELTLIRSEISAV